MRSVIVSQNHYLNQILDVHPLKLQPISSASLSLTVYQCTTPNCSLYDLMEQGQIDQNTNLSTLGHPFISTSASLTLLASACQIIATHQPLENIGNLKVLDKLMFISDCLNKYLFEWPDLTSNDRLLSDCPNKYLQALCSQLNFTILRTKLSTNKGIFMSRLHFDQDIQPLSDFRAGAASFIFGKYDFQQVAQQLFSWRFTR